MMELQMDAKVELSAVVAAVQGMADPMVPQQMRLSYMEVIQKYKDSGFSLQHLPVFLYSNDNVLVRLFGLQCCEHCITKQWTTFTPQQKEVFRDGMLRLLEEFNFATDAREETRLFNSQMGRVFVEMLKREWPQTWPNLVSHLITTANSSTGKKSVVLGILLRLCQDIVELGGEGLPSKRRSDIMTGLQENMDLIFNALMQTVVQYESTHSAAQVSWTNGTAASAELTICREALETLMAYADWVGLQYSCQGNGIFLEVLCRFLTMPSIRTQAVEILLVLMRRKGKPEEKAELRIAWENAQIFDALESAVNQLPLDRPDDVAIYSFTIRLCQLFSAIGVVAIQLRECLYRSALSPNFERLVLAILRLTAHPAKPVSYETFTFWTALIKEFPNSPAYEALFEESVLPSFLSNFKTALLKTGLPSQDSVESKFSRNEFSFDDDFLFFFSKYRYSVVGCIRLVCQHFPAQSFCFFVEWARATMATQASPGELDLSGNCTARSPCLLQWEALSVFGDGIMLALLAKPPPLSLRYPDGPALLSALLDSCTRDPLILTSQVSLLVGLLPFADGAPALVTGVLQKLLSLLPYELPGQNKSSRVKSVRNLRRHVSACMIRVARDHPQLVLPVFDALYDTVGALCTSDDISVLEKCNLIEALLLLSQHLEDASKCRQIIETILSPVRELWCSAEMSHLLGELADFMHFVGLTLPISEHEASGNNRCKIMNCVMSFYSILKRVSSSAGHSEAFLASLIMPVLPNIFRFFRTLNGLTSPEGVALRHADYADAFELTEHQKFALLGIPHPSSVQDSYNSPDTKKPCDRMNTFLHGLYEHTLFVMGLTVQALPGSLFVPLLYDTVYTFVLGHFEHLPDLKLSLILRIFLKPTFLSCPVDCYETVLVPLISLMCPLLQRILQRWRVVQQADGERDDGDNVASQEVIEEQILRNLTRHYVDLLRVLLLKNEHSAARGRAAMATEDAEMADEEAPATTAAGLPPNQLGPCAKRLLASAEVVSQVMLPSLFQLLSVPDSAASHKVVEVVWPTLLGIGMVGEAANGDSAARSAVEVDESMARELFVCVLRGLQVHGVHGDQHVSRLLTLSVQMYETFRQRFPILRSVLSEATGRSDAEIQAFEERLWPTKTPSPPKSGRRAGNAKPLNEKSRRDLFKQLSQSLMGVALSERFREEKLLVPNLPEPNQWRERARAARQRSASLSVIDSREEAGLVQLFQE